MQTVECPWCKEEHDVDKEMYNDGDCTEMFCEKCGHFFERHDFIQITHGVEKAPYDDEDTMEPCRDNGGSIINLLKDYELLSARICVYCSGVCFRHVGETCECTPADRHLRK